MQTKLLPLLIIVIPLAMYAVFQAYQHWFARKTAHLLGMMTYWVALLVISLVVLGSTGVCRVLRFHTPPNALLWTLLAIPIVLAFCFGPFAKQVPLVTPMVFLLSALLALVNTGVEELFWRGVYVESFSGLWMAYLCPAIGFAIWHFAPLSVIPYKKGALFFVLSAYVLGLCWGLVAFKTKSIGWNIVSHSLVDFSGFGALLYLNR